MYRFLAFFSISLVLFVSCRDNNSKYGYVRIQFEHHWGDSLIKIDNTTEYINAAGNVLTFHNLEYLISDLIISGASLVRIEQPLPVHYINDDTTNSIMLLTYQIPTGTYNNIRFTFGLSPEKNKSNLYPNLPPKMAWPGGPVSTDGVSGGGYHYMMIDGRWKDPTDTRIGFGLHLGALEQITKIDTSYGFSQITQKVDSITRIDTTTNKFHIQFPVSVTRSFTVEHHKITTVEPIIMDVKLWMEGRYTWDFNVMGGSIMSRRFAMDSLSRNGWNVFR